MELLLDPSRIDSSLDCRAVSFENPSAERGAGGRALGGRKGAPFRQVAPGERVVLADLRGPGRLRHWWMTFPPAPPEVMRALAIEVFYEDAPEPSISVPCLDFFALPHGRPVPYLSALTACQEGRGLNAYFPMPFRERVRVELSNGSPRPLPLYYQIDLTLERELPADAGYLHASFRRENPTRVRRDFTISGGLRGPGRFLGCSVGVRPISREGFTWYGEGEVKIYRDGDGEWPTVCGTGLEDYVGSAWGLGPHAALYGGAPLVVHDPAGGPIPDFVGFYRWHLLDPVVFASELRVTLQQIGYAVFGPGQQEALARFERTNPAAGAGLDRSAPTLLAHGLAERVDDVCATAFVYCQAPQPVPRLDLPAALADIERRPYESAGPVERLLAVAAPAGGSSRT